MAKKHTTITSRSSSADLLFEIGTEELPAAYLPGLIEQLRAETGALFQSRHLVFRSVESYGTPRRLVLIARGLSGVQQKPAEAIRGPSKHAAYDKAGKPSQALLGFLRSQGGTLAHIKVVASEKGEYVYLAKPPVETPTVKILPDLLPQLIGKLRAPKTMRWDVGGVRFARPIRWLLALYGTAPVQCAFGALASRPATWIGGPLKPRPASVKSVEAYLLTLKGAGIILDQDARHAWIKRAVEQAARKAGGGVAPEMISHGLLDEVTHLVERPSPLAGRFDQKYLALPREVLLASMAKHQRVFAIESSGKLLPGFVAILEGTPGKPAEVRKVIERILNARLADSLMFWNEDQKKLPLERMVESLEGVTFHEQLGSMADKTRRLEALAATLAKLWRLDPEKTQYLLRAARLAKADLVTNLVREFPTLQGIIGKYYASRPDDPNREPDEVASAIEQQYWLGEENPAERRLRSSSIPGDTTSLSLAIVERYDTLASYFGVGIEPSGNADPFGLRRCAQGLVEIAFILGRKYPLPLSTLFETRAQFPPFTNGTRGKVAARIAAYISERFYTFYAFSNSAITPSRELIAAVLATSCDDLTDAFERLEQLFELESLWKSKGDQKLVKAAKVIERTRNILKGAAVRQPQVDPARLQEPLERQLWDRYCTNEPRVAELVGKGAYAEATTLFGEAFFDPLHDFFEKVLVNVQEDALQQNRLALMKAINTLYTGRVADLSKLTVSQTSVQHKKEL